MPFVRIHGRVVHIKDSPQMKKASRKVNAGSAAILVGVGGMEFSKAAQKGLGQAQQQYASRAMGFASEAREAGKGSAKYRVLKDHAVSHMKDALKAGKIGSKVRLAGHAALALTAVGIGVASHGVMQFNKELRKKIKARS
jgi:hypothetical protein